MYPYNYNKPYIYNSPSWIEAMRRGDYRSIYKTILKISPEHFSKPRCPGCNAVQSGWKGRQHEHIWDASRDIRNGLTITEYIDQIKKRNPGITNQGIFNVMVNNPMKIGYTHAINTMPMCGEKTGANCNYSTNWKIKNSIIQSSGGWPSSAIESYHKRGGPVLKKKDRPEIEENYLTPAYRNLLSLNLPMSFEYPTIHDECPFLSKLALIDAENEATKKIMMDSMWSS